MRLHWGSTRCSHPGGSGAVDGSLTSRPSSSSRPLPVSLTECNVRDNNLDATSATLLTKVAREKSIMLFGIKHGQVEADLSKQHLGLADAILIASDLSVTPSLIECNLCNNSLGVEGWTIIFNALRNSPTSKITTWDLSNESIGPEIAKPLAEYISVTTSVTSVWTPAHQP